MELQFFWTFLKDLILYPMTLFWPNCMLWKDVNHLKIIFKAISR